MIYECEIINCIVCGSTYVPNAVGFFRCPQCGLLYSGQKAGFGNPIQGMSTIALRNYEIVANALERVMPLQGAKVLDIGCAEGGFTELTLRKGANSLGIEPDRDAASEALQKKLPLELVSFEDFIGGGNEYDAIVFNDVFEHMQNPTFVLEKARALLKSSGHILINAPVSNGFIFRMVEIAARLGIKSLYRRIWAQGLSSPHIYFYNEVNLKALLMKHHFELVDRGRLVVLAADGMYKRVRSTYGPVPALAISAVANIFVLISNIFPSDVMYFIFKNNEQNT